MKHLISLDVIRGIAILMVLIWHYLPRDSKIPTFLTYPTQLFWSGVDLFFVLSGFLISSILIQNVETSNYFKVFYLRRSARILPLYLLVLIGFGCVLYINPRGLQSTFDDHLPFWSYLTFTQNFSYGLRQSFSDPWLDVTWSLAVEEQFYIFLSLLIWKISKRSLAAISIILILLAPILRFFSNDYVAYVFPLQRADSLMLGVFLALLWSLETGKAFLIKNALTFRLLLIPLLLIAIYLTFRDVKVGDAAGHFWLALLYGNTLILALVSRSEKTRLFLGDKFIEWFGLRSYGIYLLHKPIQILTPYLLLVFFGASFERWITILISLCLLLIICELSYRFLEKPIIAWGHRFKYEYLPRLRG